MSEREPHTSRTWTVTEATAARIKQLAAENEIWDSEIVEKLLTRALDAVETGQWPLRRIPVKYRVDW